MNYDIKTVAANLARLMNPEDGPKISQRYIAEKAGVQHSTIGSILRGDTKSARLETIDKIAKALGKTIFDLTGGDVYFPQRSIDSNLSEIESEASDDLLVMGGVVQAGPFWPEDELTQVVRRVRFARDPRFPHASQRVYEVKGDSMDLAGIPEGSMVRAIDWGDTGYGFRPGLKVVARRTRNGGHLIELSVKEIEQTRDGWQLCPRSTNPIHKPFDLRRSGHVGDDSFTVEVIGLVTAVKTEFRY